MLTIEQLRKNNYKVRVKIFRYGIGYGKKLIALSSFRDLGLQNLITSRGGMIEVYAVNKFGRNYVGVSLCSIEDNFNRKEGLKIALKRLEDTIDTGVLKEIS